VYQWLEKKSICPLCRTPVRGGKLLDWMHYCPEDLAMGVSPCTPFKA
jgi:hypothetical protein